MNSLAKKSLAILLALPLLLALSGPATAVPTDPVELPDPDFGVNALLFGDFTVYSLALLNFLPLGDTSVTPGDDFSVQSASGLLKDDIVIGSFPAAALDNSDLTVGAPPMDIGNLDDSFVIPDGGPTFFFTDSTNEPGGTTPEGPWDMIGTWDAEAAALRKYLLGDPLDDTDDSDLVFYFNLNESGTDDLLAGNDLLAWAAVTLWNSDDGLLATFLLRGPDSDPGGPTPSATSGDFPIDPTWAYIHGRICVNTATLEFVQLGACTSGNSDETTINQNLGQDQAAFALFNATLNEMILDPAFGVFRLSIDFRFGAINNGFEQIFIRRSVIDEPDIVPEPGTLSLFAFGLLALGIRLRRRKRS